MVLDNDLVEVSHLEATFSNAKSTKSLHLLQVGGTIKAYLHNSNQPVSTIDGNLNDTVVNVHSNGFFVNNKYYEYAQKNNNLRDE